MQLREAALGIAVDLEPGVRRLQSPLEGELGLATRAVGEVGFDAAQLRRVEALRHVPRQQGLDRLVRVQVNDTCIAHNQPSSRSANKAFSRRRAWNMRVFTVSTGQSTICAISR